MTANELAKSISQKVTNDAISRGQGEFLFKLAQQSGQAEIAGQRTASGSFDGKTWKLSFYKGVPYFKVQ